MQRTNQAIDLPFSSSLPSPLTPSFVFSPPTTSMGSRTILSTFLLSILSLLLLPAHCIWFVQEFHNNVNCTSHPPLSSSSSFPPSSYHSAELQELGTCVIHEGSAPSGSSMYLLSTTTSDSATGDVLRVVQWSCDDNDCSMIPPSFFSPSFSSSLLFCSLLHCSYTFHYPPICITNHTTFSISPHHLLNISRP